MPKITGKKTIMFFNDKPAQKDCINYLSKLNVKFRAALSNNWVEIAPKQYKRHELDLLLPSHIGISSFCFK